MSKLGEFKMPKREAIKPKTKTKPQISYTFTADNAIKITVECNGQTVEREIDLSRGGELKTGQDKNVIKAAIEFVKIYNCNGCAFCVGGVKTCAEVESECYAFTCAIEKHKDWRQEQGEKNTG